MTRRNGLWWLFAALWFAGWHLGFTWQVWADPLHQVPGPIGDNTVMLWNLGWVKHALSHGQPGFWFDTAYYPEGFLFLYGTHTWLDGVLYWLASPLLPDGYSGAILWANITMLTATITSGLFIIGALRAWGIINWPVLILAASGATFSWFRMYALTGHYHFFGTQWMLLALWLISLARKSYQNENRRRGNWFVVCAGLVTGLTFLNDQAMAVFAGMLGGLVIVTMPRTTDPSRYTTIAKLALSFYLCALITASIHLVPMLMAIADGRLQYEVKTDAARLVDASSFVFPPDRHIVGRMLETWRDRYSLRWQEGTYLGVMSICFFVLMCAGSIKYLLAGRNNRPRELRLCFYATLAAGSFLLLALGDTFMIGDQKLWAMPGRLLKMLPVLNNIRLPQRFVWPAHLCIALGGASITSLLVSRWSFRGAVWLPLALALLPGLEALKHPPPQPTNYRLDPVLHKTKLVKAVQNQYREGGVLVMPPRVYYGYGNILQFLWGYDIPVTIAYTARMPVEPNRLPWHGNQWTPEAGQWLREHQVGMIIFPVHGGQISDFEQWIAHAKKAVPGLVVLNQDGVKVKSALPE